MRPAVPLLAASLALSACAVAVAPVETAPSGSGPIAAGVVIAPVSPGEAMSGEEIGGVAFIAIVRGNTLVPETGSGGALIYVAPDGAVFLLVVGADGERTRQGRILEAGGRPCWSFKEVENGRPQCFRAFRDGEKLRAVKEDGSAVEGSWTVLPGRRFEA